MSSVDLFIPDLLPAGTAPTAALPRPGALQRLLARARVTRQVADDYTAMLCGAFGVARQRDWPVAPLTLLADGLQPQALYWLRADPVHLRADRADLVLVDSDRVGIAHGDARKLVAALDEYFATEGLRFCAPASQRWYVSVAGSAEIETVPLAAATGKSIRALLPRGAQGRVWHRRFNEAQMLMHAHPVNVEREARGEPAINSVWFWGGGVLPARASPPTGCAWGDDPLARGLARWAGLDVLPLPDDAIPVLARPGPHWVMLGPPAGVDAAAALQELERAWFAPLLAALSQRTLRAVRLHTLHAGQALRFELAPADLWKLWRRGFRAPGVHA